MRDSIAQRFSGAAQGYEQAARVQRQAAEMFDLWLTQCALPAPGSIAEIGCGTGLFTRLLQRRYSAARLLATDLAPRMVALCRAETPASPQLRFDVCDGRDARFDPAPDWIVSTMCFQWFDPLLPVVRHHLGQAEVLAFSLVLDGSFSAWRQAHDACGISAGLRRFAVFEDLAEACRQLGAAEVKAHRTTLEEIHPNGLAFARGLRALGADHPRDGHAPASLRQVLRTLADEFVANYEIGFFCLRR